MSSTGARRRRWSVRLAGALTVALVAAACVPPDDPTPPADPALPETVTADALPTVQINGVVWDQAIVGDRVYVTGEFTQARPAGAAPGTNQTPRSHILAYDLHTGELISDWAPSLNAQGFAITASEDGSVIYVGGDFDQVNGQWRSRIAAIDAQTGQVVPGFFPMANTRVGALAVSGDTLYFGGFFTTVDGQARTRLAAVDATTGDLLPWAPTADRDVVTMVVHPGSGRVIVGGSFFELNGTQQWGMGSLDGVTGEVMPWAANTIITNRGPSAYISGLATDGEMIYGVGWAFFLGDASANFEGTFSAHPLTGDLDWVNGCRGDQFDIAIMGEVLYTVGHPHDCGMVDWLPEARPRMFQLATAIHKHRSPHGLYNAYGPLPAWEPFAGLPAAEMLHWLPTLFNGSYTGTNQAAFTVDANDEYVVLGGEFPRVNSTNQQGLVRFPVKEAAPNVEGPVAPSETQPMLTPLGPGTVRVGWRAAWDRDDERLTHEVLRGSTVANSTVLKTLETDTNHWTRPPLGFVDTTAPPGSTQTYRVRVTDPLGNGWVSPASTITIPAGTPPGSVYRATVAADNPTHHWRMGEPSGSVARDWAGSNDLTLSDLAQRGAPGALLNEQSTATSWPGTSAVETVQGTTSFFQRGPQTFSLEAWVRTTTNLGGKIIGFGDANGFGDRPIDRSRALLTDRHIYMTDDGQFRFGVRPDMGARITINSASGYNDGQWHHVVGTLGADGMKLYVDGELVASNADVTKAQTYWGFWRVAGDQLRSWPRIPTDEAIDATLDEIAVYPHALSLQRVQLHHQASGRGDDLPNVPPTASFTSSTDGLTASFDASGSSDPDGQVVSWQWDFGDGAVGSGEQVEHTYAEPDTYTVMLTVTDDEGATDSASAEITVAEEYALDRFERTVTNGFGTAEIGGPWTLQGPAGNFSVGDGVGRISGNVSANRAAYLEQVSATDVDLVLDLSLDTEPSGGGAFVSVIGRRVSSGNDYRLLVRYMPNGEVVLHLMRVLGGAQTVLSWTTVPNVSVSPGDVLRARFQATGTETTTLRAKVWPEGTLEPASWLLDDGETTPTALQGPGHLGVLLFTSGSWTGTAPTLSIDNLQAEPPSTE